MGEMARVVIAQAPQLPQLPEVPPVPPVPQAPSAPSSPERIVVSKNGKTVSIGQDGRIIVRESGTSMPPMIAGGPLIPSQAVDISVAFFMMIAFIAVGSPLARAFARRMDRRALAPAAPTDDPARLTRIEQSIEAIALEVERIGEGQRYVTQLMSSRAESSRDETLRVGGGQ